MMGVGATEYSFFIKYNKLIYISLDKSLLKDTKVELIKLNF